ncbi:MAG: 2-hydroxyacid dehydrogenase [Candidatus Thorarchaeota archaeon]
MKILVPYSQEMADTIQRMVGSEATVVRSDGDIESMIEHGGDATILVSGRAPAEFIQAASNLRLIQSFGAGVNRIDREAILAHGDVMVCNSTINAPEVAEYAIALLFAAAKNLAMNDREMRKGDWSLRWGGPIYNIELRDKTCLLVGLGNIGKEIAIRLKSFGLRIYAVTRTGVTERVDLIDNIIPLVQIHEVLDKADFVILALPLTDMSRGLVDESFLRQMNSSSILINISRGEIVDEGALYKVLKENQIRGAAFDVWWRYPRGDSGPIFYPSEEFPFHELDNLTLSPHRASYSEKVKQDMFTFAVENILRFIQGETPLNIVNMEIGY